MIIYYHGACPDGWTAAWVAKRRYPDAILRPLDHGLTNAQIDALVAESTDQNVLMLDYSLRTRENNDRLAVAAKSFLMLDHHKTARAALEGAPYAIFDMERSGAGLAFDYLFGKDSDPSSRKLIDWVSCSWFNERPWFINYIEARDLWRWGKLPQDRAICAYLGSLPFTVEAYNKLNDLTPEKAAQLGEGALANIEHFVRESIKNARPGRFLGHDIMILNATYLNCSEIGNELSKQATFSVTWFERADDIIQFSLRSIGNFDVSEIAKQFNGGGHKNAAGFQLQYETGRNLVDAILSRVSYQIISED